MDEPSYGATSTEYRFVYGSDEPCPYVHESPVRGSHGVSVAFAQRAWTHGAEFGGVTIGISTFLDDLSKNVMLTVDQARTTSWAGLAATQARVAYRAVNGSSSYPDLHLPPLTTISLQCPSQLTVAAADDGFYVVHIWAATSDDLEKWLPAATHFVRSMKFVDKL